MISSTCLPSSRELFGDRGDIGCALRHQRADVGGGGNDHGALETLVTEVELNEFLHLAAAFANQADDNHVRCCVACHHPKQHALADARPSNKPSRCAPTVSSVLMARMPTSRVLEMALALQGIQRP